MQHHSRINLAALLVVSSIALGPGPTLGADAATPNAQAIAGRWDGVWIKQSDKVDRHIDFTIGGSMDVMGNIQYSDPGRYAGWTAGANVRSDGAVIISGRGGNSTEYTLKLTNPTTLEGWMNYGGNPEFARVVVHK